MDHIVNNHALLSREQKSEVKINVAKVGQLVQSDQVGKVFMETKIHGCKLRVQLTDVLCVPEGT
jgi:hypothetical protein